MLCRWKVWREAYAGEVMARSQGDALLAAIRQYGDEVCRVQSVASWEIAEEERRARAARADNEAG